MRITMLRTMMSGWNFHPTTFIYLLLGYLLLVSAESVFPKIQPVYTDSFLPAAAQVSQHLIDKIDEVSHKSPDAPPIASTTTDASSTSTTPMTATTGVPPPTSTFTSPTTTHIPPLNMNILPTTTHIPPLSTNTLPSTTDISPTTTTTSSTSINMSSVTTPANVPPKTNIPLSMTASDLTTTVLTSLPMESESQSSVETTKQTSNSAINEHTICKSITMLVNESIIVNETVNEHLIESVFKKNGSDKLTILTGNSIHKNETLRYTIASIVLMRLRDILAVEAKRQGMSKIQGYSTALLKLLVSTSKMTSSDQLSFILVNMLRNGDAKRRESIAQSRIVLENLARKHSSLSTVLMQIPAFQYT